MLSLKKFSKSFGSVEVLKIDNLNLKSGIYWIKGENGSGKSTLMKSIAGIIDFRGEISLNDSLICNKHTVAYRKLVNFAEAEPLFPDFLTGDELMNLFANAKNAPPNQADFYIEAMKMREYIKEPVGSYSSGMLKKLSIVLAFLGKPQLILLDEPLITLDAESLKILYAWIEQKYQKEQISFLISSHQSLDLTVDYQTITVKDHTAKLN